MQSTTIHTIGEIQLWAVTIAKKQNQATQERNRFFPDHVGQVVSLSAATATPSLRQYMTQA
jgi:hypothetical protein